MPPPRPAGFTVSTPRRCFGHDPIRPGQACGRPALWMLEPTLGNAAQFFCDAHRRSGVVPIALDAPYRRVSVTLEILVSAAELTPAAAHQEAVALLVDAVTRVGGVPSLMYLTSTIGRDARQAPAGGAADKAGGRE